MGFADGLNLSQNVQGPQFQDGAVFTFVYILYTHCVPPPSYCQLSPLSTHAECLWDIVLDLDLMTCLTTIDNV